MASPAYTLGAWRACRRAVPSIDGVGCVRVQVSCGRADSAQFVPCMPAIPAPATCCGGANIGAGGGSFDLPTLHVGGTVTLDREARVMRCAPALPLLFSP